MTNKIQRYEWEDALLAAEAAGLIRSGAVNMCLRLARAINWVPKDQRPSGLYWKNEDALNSVGSSRSTYYEYRRELFAQGFFVEISGNLIPQVPVQSDIRTDESETWTTKSDIRTTQSEIDTPYTEDIYTEDLCTDDSFTDAAPTAPQGVKEVTTNLNTPKAASPPTPSSLDLLHSDSGSAAPSSFPLTSNEENAVDSKRDTDGGPARRGLAPAEALALSEWGQWFPKDATPVEQVQVARRIVWQQKQLPKKPVNVRDLLNEVRTRNAIAV